jgi:hypothetical protein
MILIQRKASAEEPMIWRGKIPVRLLVPFAAIAVATNADVEKTAGKLG